MVLSIDALCWRAPLSRSSGAPYRSFNLLDGLGPHLLSFFVVESPIEIKSGLAMSVSFALRDLVRLRVNFQGPLCDVYRLRPFSRCNLHLDPLQEHLRLSALELGGCIELGPCIRNSNVSFVRKPEETTEVSSMRIFCDSILQNRFGFRMLAGVQT